MNTLPATVPEYTPTAYDSVENRYLRDPAFRALTDMMEQFIHNCQYSPSEMREAALLSAIHYESRTVRPLRMYFQLPGVEQQG